MELDHRSIEEWRNLFCILYLSFEIREHSKKNKGHVEEVFLIDRNLGEIGEENREILGKAKPI